MRSIEKMFNMLFFQSTPLTNNIKILNTQILGAVMDNNKSFLKNQLLVRTKPIYLVENVHTFYKWQEATTLNKQLQKTHSASTATYRHQPFPIGNPHSKIH